MYIHDDHEIIEFDQEKIVYSTQIPVSNLGCC